MQLVNYYDYLKNNKDPYFNPNAKLGAIIHPAKILIIGSSGNSCGKPGKTNLLLNIIDKCNNFERFYIFAKTLNNDKLYDEVLIPKLQKVWKKFKTKILIQLSNTLDDLPDIELIDENFQNLIVFDDMINEKTKDLKKIEEYFTRARKMNCSMVLITQSYFETPNLIRYNSDYYMFLSINTCNNIHQIAKDMAISIDKNKFVKMFEEVLKTSGLNFFMIDRKTDNALLKYRRNFNGIYFD